MRPSASVLAAFILVLSVPAHAEDLTPGEVVRKVACGPTGQYSYARYLPRKYDPKTPCPILYCFSPGGDGDSYVEYWREACEEAGWICVGSNDSRNGPIQLEAIKAMWEHTRAHLAIREKHVYATGFSGGARVSWWFSCAKEFDPKAFAGLILVGAVKSSGGGAPDPAVAIWMMCGEEDFNRPEVEACKKELERAKRKSETRVFPGEHQMPDPPLRREAVQWLDRQSPSGRESALKAALAKAAELKDADPYGAALALEAVVNEFSGAKEKDLAEAKKQLAALDKDPRVRRERTAAKELARIRKLEGRTKDPPSPAEILKEYDDLVRSFPDTHASVEAQARRKELKGE